MNGVNTTTNSTRGHNMKEEHENSTHLGNFPSKIGEKSNDCLPFSKYCLWILNLNEIWNDFLLLRGLDHVPDL